MAFELINVENYTVTERPFVILRTMRRGFIFAVALSLAQLGPVPLSACATFSSKLAECATPKTEARCNQMDMGESGAKLVAAPNVSCCSLKAPVSASLVKASEFSLAAPLAIAANSLRVPVSIEEQHFAPPVRDASPPPLQSLLCVFLI
jgi:hypothetical protein